MHIEIVNTLSKYECIMVRSNDPGRVNRGKGYRVVNRLDRFDAIWDVNGIHSGLGCGRSQQPILLALRLILVVNRAAQYVVYGGPRFRRELCAGYYSFNHGGSLNSADILPNISPEVVGPN